jgi:hypothetical protein
MVGRERGARHAVSNSAPFNTNRSEKPDLRQAIEESLHREILEQFLKWTLLRAGLVEEALSDRRAHITTAHRIASRYGRMIRCTRLIWANLDSD